MRYDPSNKEAAQMLRGLRKEIDNIKEEREPGGTINLIRDAEEAIAVRETTTTTEQPRTSALWDFANWDFSEWNDFLLITNFEGTTTADEWRAGFPSATDVSVSTDPNHVYAGDQAAFINTTATFTWASASGSGLPYYPQLGDMFRAPQKIFTEDGFLYTIFGYQDASNCYFVDHRRDGRLRIRRRVGGTETTIGPDSTIAEAAGFDGWRIPVINWRQVAGGVAIDVSLLLEDADGTFRQVGAVEGTDATSAFTSGGFGYGVTGGTAGSTRQMAVDFPHIIQRPGYTG